MRKAGVLLHITSLPSSHGIGDFGKEAYKFVDFLKKNKLILWEILPLNPTSPDKGNSPYSSYSLFAGNYVLIDPEGFVKKGLLEEKDLKTFPPEDINYSEIYRYKEKILRKAYKRFKKGELFEEFVNENKRWLEDFALYCALWKETGKHWFQWEEELKRRESEALEKAKKELKEEIEFYKFSQFVFFYQWKKLKKYANGKGIHIIGDLPIYPSYESVDVWVNPHLFKLDSELKPKFVAGVPPDFFSPTGQLWGNPVYNWEEHKKENFSWWIYRISHNLNWFDYIRLDHFRGYVAHWEVPYGEKTAENGKWVKAPAKEFLKTLLSYFPQNPFIAEDLGFITDDVRYVRKLFKIPGSRIVEFGFYPDGEEHLPHSCGNDIVLYTSNHDLPPLKGWFQNAPNNVREKLFKYLGRELEEEELVKEVIRFSLLSGAKFVIIQMQDILNLGNEARMNVPGKPFGNWKWRMDKNYQHRGRWIKELIELYGRF
jgi:4-alpha-glucanotransferase